MKPWIAMVCCLVFFLTTESSHSKPKTHRKDEDKFQISLQKHEFRPRQGKCDGLCSSSSSCNQSCPWNFRGEIVFTCNHNKWQKTIETCTSLSVDTLFQRIHPAASLSLASSSVFPMSLIGNAAPVYIGNVFQGIQKYCPEDYVCIVDAVKSSAVTSGNIAFIVELLKNISSNLQTSGIHDNVNWKKMKNYGKVANHILGPTAISNWAFIANKNASSDLLESVNSFAKKLQIQGKSESIVDELFIQTKGSRISHSSSEQSLSLSVPRYNATEDVLVVIEIPRQALQELSFNTSQAIAVAFPTLGAILKEVHRPNTSLQKPIDDLILSLVLPEGLNEIILTFDKINKSQSTSSQCVSWDPATGQWDESPCTVMSDINSTVKCRCRHTKAVTSFSILMSSKPVKNTILNHITFIGLSVSIFSLVLCLVIEAIVWSRVVVTEISYMRHVCIVNIAVSLLTANVWFIIGSNFSANVQEDHKWCVAVTFLCHFFFLSLFFWMLFKALLIVYGILVVFRRMMKSRMMAIGFAIGYGCPLVIAVITVTVTEPGEGYTRKDACWLNWNQTKALFAFAIPALAIVAVNLLVVLAVAINTQRPLIGSSKSQDMAIVFRISKNVAILTPLLGLTWGFGLTTLLEGVHLVFHIIFALLNAFQGFFILLFGTIMDHKIRDALRMRVSSLKGKSRAAEKVSLSPANGSRILNR